MRYPRRPRQPKASASVVAFENWGRRMVAWEARCKEIKDAPKKKQAIKDKHRRK